MRTTQLTIAGLTALALASAAASVPQRPGFGQATLTGFAALPAQTWVTASDPSGSALGTAPINGVTPPFADQPVQGFSGIVRNADGSFDVLSDNGYGSQANSADFVLRIHRIAPNWHDHEIDVVGGVNLTDPDGLVPWPLTRPDRVLTGSDFDAESIVKADDGGYWVGDEFGPYLLRFDRAGRLAAAPIPLPDVNAPERAAMLAVPANLPGSRGFEGMAASPDGRYLYPMLEGTVSGDTPGALRIYEFDRRTESYTGRRWVYTLDSAAHAIGDFVAVDRHRFLVIERDNQQGGAARFKRIFLIDLDGRKTQVADLLDIADPRQIFGAGEPFRFPFVTIEDVVVIDNRTIGVLNDNNFPFSSGRTPGQPDNNEFIMLRLTRALR